MNLKCRSCVIDPKEIELLMRSEGRIVELRVISCRGIVLQV